MVCSSAEARKAITDVSLLVPSLDVSEFNDLEVCQALLDTRIAQRCLDGYVSRLGSQANRLSEDGKSAPADETLRGRGNVGSAQARREAKRSETGDEFPSLGDAASCGETSGEHVDAVARHLAKLTEEQRGLIDTADLVEQAKSMLPEAFDRYVRRLVEQVLADHGLGDANAKRQASEFRHWFDRKSGMGRFSGCLDPERYEAITNVIDQHMATLAAQQNRSDGDGVPVESLTFGPNLAANALVELVLGAGGRNARNRLPSVTVIVDHDTIVHGAHSGSVRQTEHGYDVAPETIARLCCDATIRRVTMDATGVPINVGRKYRTATDAQWAAIKSLHSTCAWGDCGSPISWCQAHHIREWENGGPTDLENLVPLCSRHHHRVHEGGWHIKLAPDRKLKIIKPDGTFSGETPTPRRE